MTMTSCSDARYSWKMVPGLSCFRNTQSWYLCMDTHTLTQIELCIYSVVRSYRGSGFKKVESTFERSHRKQSTVETNDKNMGSIFLKWYWMFASAYRINHSIGMCLQAPRRIRKGVSLLGCGVAMLVCMSCCAIIAMVGGFRACCDGFSQMCSKFRQLSTSKIVTKGARSQTAHDIITTTWSASKADAVNR